MTKHELLSNLQSSGTDLVTTLSIFGWMGVFNRKCKTGFAKNNGFQLQVCKFGGGQTMYEWKSMEMIVCEFNSLSYKSQ